MIKGMPTLFNSCNDEKVEQLAQHCYQEIKSKKKIDRVSTASEEFDLINLKTLKNKNIREVGAESMCFQAFRQLKIDNQRQGLERRANQSGGNPCHQPGRLPCIRIQDCIVDQRELGNMRIDRLRY